MKVEQISRKLDKLFPNRLQVKIDACSVVVSGQLDTWEQVLAACRSVHCKGPWHVVNNIECPQSQQKMRLPEIEDEALEGAEPDVLIIGCGISGSLIARELAKKKLSVLVLDKESDVAMQASGRNDGEVHPGVDLGKGSLKQKYVVDGNRRYEELCKDLDVPFERCGQFVGFTNEALKPVVSALAAQRRSIGVTDSRIASKKEVFECLPNLNPKVKFALANDMAGSVCPYSLVIAAIENAVDNGVRLSLNTAVLGMKTQNGTIVEVSTNRGKIRPKVVINASGVFADVVAEMAGDKFFSIHPRRGTNSILDKKTGPFYESIGSVKELKGLSGGHSHTKGGGIVHTAHGNLLIGPDAVETPLREDFSTTSESIKHVFDKQRGTMPRLSERDIITYFTGVRACTFEEDFIIEKGRKVKNLVHCAGIQSPGLTAAPAFAPVVAQMAIDLLGRDVEDNLGFNGKRKGIVRTRSLAKEERDALIKKNPAYGEIICRCEEISKGEIIDALDSPVCVPTLDGVKKRVRPGMGRCQGGFCSPLVIKIISEHCNIKQEEVKKGSKSSIITFGKTKAVHDEEL